MESARGALDKVLEVHFCDLDETSEHESLLGKAVTEYISFLNIRSIATMLDSLADEKRLIIFHLLTIREMCNCELTAALKTTQPNLTYHVKKLENAGIVNKRRDGKFIYYSLVDSPRIDQLRKLTK